MPASVRVGRSDGRSEDVDREAAGGECRLHLGPVRRCETVRRGPASYVDGQGSGPQSRPLAEVTRSLLGRRRHVQWCRVLGLDLAGSRTKVGRGRVCGTRASRDSCCQKHHRHKPPHLISLGRRECSAQCRHRSGAVRRPTRPAVWGTLAPWSAASWRESPGSFPIRSLGCSDGRRGCSHGVRRIGEVSR